MTQKLRIDLQLLLPDLPGVADACVGRLLDELRGRPGIDEVHLKEVGDQAQLCVHYDPGKQPLARIREVVDAAGATISGRYGHVTWHVSGIAHVRRARTVEDRLRRAPGVLEASVGAAGLVHVEYDRTRIDSAELLEILAELQVKPTTTLTSSGERLAAPAGVTEQGDVAAKTQVHDRNHDRNHNHNHNHNHDGDHSHDNDPHGHDSASGGVHDHAHGGILGENAELIFALLCGLLLAAGFLVEKLAGEGAGGWPTVCYVGAYIFGGFYTVREAIDNLRLRRFEIDTLMLVAAAGAAALGAWAEGALLLFLFSLGHALEHYAMGRAKRAIEALAELAPETATIRRGERTVEVQVGELVVGDVVLVRPNERMPADGFVLSGASAVNQAPVTGESIPVDKRAVPDTAAARLKPDAVDGSSRVFAGTINGGGALEVEVTRKASESTLARVVKMVSEAETRKSPTQRFTDKFERVFVPAVLALAFLLLFAWVFVDEPFRDSFYRAMAVLVAASPCALAIATPSAVLSGIARAARSGVLIKGGAPLEELGALRAIAFDKTGTLTEGRPRITDVVAVDGASEEDLLAVAVAAEAMSDHPLAAAIVRDGKTRLGQRDLPAASGLESLTGRGITAIIDGLPTWIGKAEMFGMDGVPGLGAPALAAIATLRDAGRTTMFVRQGERDLGAIGLLDTPRDAARETLRRLREVGIERMLMISGDHQKVASAIAADVGLDEAWGDLMPEDKVEAIRKLRTTDKVAMVGDGVNDAPAMANATVGIAMGAAGSDVALETADVALMSDDLRQLPFAVGLSRRTRSVIRQNVWVSLGVVAFLVPATILGLGIGPAVALHEGSTLLVVVNALRLLAYRDELLDAR